MRMQIAKVFKTPKKQAGAALVVAMLIISLVTAIAATSSLRHHFMLRRLSNQLKVTQLNSYLRATEMIAKKALTADLQLDSQQNYRFDHWGEIWAQKVPPFLIEGGSYGGEIIDLQGRFNLNTLAQKKQLDPSKTVPFTIEQGIFIRLLQSYNDDNLQITNEQAVEITKAALDWVDADTTENFSYCEDNAYTAIEKRKPHRTANQPFMSVSELRLLCNMPPELYIRIKEDLTVWPRTGKSTINVNTASKAILRSVFLPSTDVSWFQTSWKSGQSYTAPRPLEDRDLEQFLEQQKQGFTSWSQVQSTLSYVEPWPAQSPVLSLHSDYFLLKAVAELDGLTQRYLSVLDRTTSNKIKVLFRSYDDL